MGRQRRAAGIIVGAIAVAAVLGAWRHFGAVPAAASSAASSAVSSAAAVQSGPAAAAAHQASWLGNAGAARPPPDMREPLAAQVQRLAAGASPGDGYQAYWLIADCMALQADGDIPSEPGSADTDPARLRQEQQFCGGLTQRMRMARIDYLHKAAEAGVPCADMQQLREGPFGDPSALQTRPDDPLVKEWQTQAQGLALRHADGGDYCTLNMLTMDYFRPDPRVPLDDAHVLTYGLAMRSFHQAMHHPPAVLVLVDAMNLQAHTDKLTPAQVAEASAKAQQIAALMLQHAGAARP